jgi:hypothetical protein
VILFDITERCGNTTLRCTGVRTGGVQLGYTSDGRFSCELQGGRQACSASADNHNIETVKDHGNTPAAGPCGTDYYNEYDPFRDERHNETVGENPRSYAEK